VPEETGWELGAARAVRAARVAVEREGSELRLTLDELDAILTGYAVVEAEAMQELRREIDNLKTALVSRAVIEQAKGILIAQSRVTPEEAFQLLVRASQRENVKLKEIAARMVEKAANLPPRSL
jgi:AmiR/NasT family two-component response regulator